MTGIAEQALELGWRYNPLEHRDEHGEWTRGGELTHLDGAGYADPDTQHLDSTRATYKSPADHPFFREHPVTPEHITAVYDRTAPQVREQGMRWYADAHTIAKAIAGGDADKGAGVLAAYSPQTNWPVNMMNAARALELGRAIGPGEGMITGAMQDNAQEAIDGEPADVANSSSKTRAFARLIRNGGDMPDDDQGDVVIDRHAMSVAMGRVLPKAESDKAPIDKDRFYQYVADQYREAAKQISDRDGTPVAPHQLQAITWLQQQAENEALDAAGGGQGSRGQQGGRLAKGRQTSVRNAWQKWGAEAQALHVPVHPGTTAIAAAGIAEQVIELRGHWDGWRHELRGKDGRWVRDPGAALLEKGPAPARVPGSERQDAHAVAHTFSTSGTAVPAMFGSSEHLDWDGKTPTIYPDHERPGLLAEMGWDGHVSMNATTASGINKDLSSPAVDDPASLEVALHEMIHGVIPQGESRMTNGDREAYRNPACQRIEEGFTELGAVQHAPEFFAQQGVGDHPTPMLAASGNGTHPTAAQYAQRVADPDRIKSQEAWGHYGQWTADAYNWAATISRQGGGKEDPADIRRISDQINAVGTAAKTRVMAEQVMVASGLDRVDPPLSAGERTAALADTEQTIRASWGKTSADSVASQAATSFQTSVQGLREAERAEAERAAA